MASEFELSVAHFVVYRGNILLPEFVMLPFQENDRISPESSTVAVPHIYRSNAQTVARRLDLLGFSLDAARRAFEKRVGQLQAAERKNWPSQLLQPGGFQFWCDVMKVLIDASRRHDYDSPWMSDDEGVKEILRWEDRQHEEHVEYLYGFPCEDPPLLVLRAILSVASADDDVVLDFDELITEGCVRDDENLWSIEAQQPLIVLTEGKSDSRILRESLDVLLPELRGFLTFIDFETANAKGGIHELVQFVRMFIGCGIRNRIVVLFDNDAAGSDALQRLLEAPLPPHVFAMTLPPLEHARSYPTLGPDGPSMSDINGRACSIELYLGNDVLSGDDRHSIPIRWSGYMEKTNRYQGRITNKGDIQKRYFQKLAQAREAPKERRSLDFSDVLAIFEEVFRVLADG